jgi:hypothetical protein
MERTMDVSTVTTVSEDEGTFVHFKDAAGELLFDVEGEGESAVRKPVGVRVAGTYSSQYKKVTRKVRERNTKRRSRGMELDADVVDANGNEIVAACILDWTFTANGQPFPITGDNWGALIAKQPQWEEQVDAAMVDHARFFVKSSSS